MVVCAGVCMGVCAVVVYGVTHSDENGRPSLVMVCVCVCVCAVVVYDVTHSEQSLDLNRKREAVLCAGVCVRVGVRVRVRVRGHVPCLCMTGLTAAVQSLQY